MTISIQKLHELFQADFENGILYRRDTGKVAGGKCRVGKDTFYCRVQIEKRNYYLHRLIFAMKHGYFPQAIDHIDGDTLNCKIDNLRDASTSDNMRNRSFKQSNWGTGITHHKVTTKGGKLNEYYRVSYLNDHGKLSYQHFNMRDYTLLEAQAFALNKRAKTFSDRHLTTLINAMNANPEFQAFKNRHQ